MSVMRSFFVALALMTLAAPVMAQTNGDSVRGGGDGGGFHGGRGVRFGIVPGLLLPALGAAARAAQHNYDEPPPPRIRRKPRPPIHARPPHPPAYHPKETTIAARPVAPRKTHAHGAARAPVAVKAPVASKFPAALHMPPPGENRFLPDEILVVLRANTSTQEIEDLRRRRRLDLVQTRDLALIGERVHRFRFADQRSVQDVLRAMAQEKLVVWAEPNYLYTLQEDMEKSAPEASPGVKEEAPPPSYSGALLHLREAHRLATGRGVRVAVIDSQIDFDHPDIHGAVTERFDALEGASVEPQSHGTGMASAIAGRQRIDGVAPDVNILAVRVFRDGARASALDIIAGIDWSAAQKARVINMSFAGPPDPLMARMLAAAAQRGIVLIAAAGNEGPQSAPLFPAADDHVIAVSAIDEQARIYPMANRGDYIALAAPGVDVLVAAPRGAYDLSTGTSVACAEVSGIAALVLEERPALDGPALRRLLRASAHALSGAKEVGAGVADAEAAIERKD
jgi:hypothetical protein